MSGTNNSLRTAALILLLLPVPALSAPGDSIIESPKGIVDCLLPGALRRVGGALYQMPQRAARIPAAECTIRGGDFLLYDRANYETSLQHWITQANQGSGNSNAMMYVAEIYEQGIGREPDYAAAAEWYRKAADAGNTTAMSSLAHLYKTGKGVELDLEQAQQLYSEAFGTNVALPLDPTSVKGADQRVETLVAEVDEIRRQKIAVELELEAANEQLANARRNLDQAMVGDGENAELIRELQASIEQQRAEIAQYSAAAEIMRAENEELLSLRQQLEDKEVETERLKSLLAAAESTVDGGMEELERQRQALDARQVEFNALLADIDADRETLRDRSEQLEEQRAVIKSMEADLRKAEEERDLYRSLASDAATQEDRVRTLSARIAELEQRSSDAAADTESMRQRLQSAQSQLDEQLRATAASSEASADEIEAREAEIVRLRAAVVRAEQEATRHNNDIDRLSQQSAALEQLRADLEREQAQSNRLQKLLTESQDQYAASNQRVEQLSTSRTELETEIETLRSIALAGDQASQEALQQREQQLAAQREEMQALQARIAESESDFDRYQQQMADTATRQSQAIESLRAAVEASHTERAQLEEKLASAGRQLDSALTDLDVEQQRYAALQDELREARARRSASDEALNAMQARLDGQNQQVALLEQERRRLDEQAARYLAQINDLKERAQARKVEFVGPRVVMLEPNENLLTDPETALRGEEGLPEVSVIRAGQVGETKIIRGRVDAPGGLAQLTIDGWEVTFDENYAFTQSLKLDAASKHIRIVAVDHNGKQDVKEFRYEIDGGAAQAAAIHSKASQFEESRNDALDHLRYYALIIANQDYQNEFMADLETPINDAEAIGAVLEKRYGFDVDILVNADKDTIEEALERIFYVEENDDNEENDKDAILIYYAGHGTVSDSRTNDAYFWIPVDAQYDSPRTWFKTREIESYMQVSAVNQIMVVADSCFAGNVLSRDGISGGFASLKAQNWRKFLTEYTEKKKSRYVLTSGGFAPVLDGGGGDHSVFARAFLDVLTANNEIMSASRMHEQVAPIVLDLAERQDFNQTPLFGYLRSAGHGFGNFYLPAPYYEAQTVSVIGNDRMSNQKPVAASSDQ
jgi:predicted  nucleic acid-binding Zn-ribbon protein